MPFSGPRPVPFGAAAHFFNLCQGILTKRHLFGYDEVPDTGQIQATVVRAVRMFLRAYGPRPGAES